MTPSQAKALLPIITAFSEGKEIQFALAKNYPWYDCPDPHFDDPSVWRIKPTAKYRPWTQEEVPLGKVVRCIQTRSRHLITDAIVIHVYLGETCYSVTDMLNDFIMDDDSPCGVLES